MSRSRDAASPPRRGGPSPRPKRSPSPEGSGPPGQDAGTGLSAGPAGGGQSGQGPRGLGEPSLPGPQSPLLQDGAPCRLHQLPLPTEAASPSPEQQAPGHTTPPPQGPHAPAHGTPQSQRISSGIAPVLGFRGSLGSSGTSKRASQEGEPGPGFTWVPQREERNRHKAARRWGHPETGDTPRLQAAGLTPAPPAPPLASGPRQPEPTPRLCGGGPCSGSTRSPRNTAPKPPPRSLPARLPLTSDPGKATPRSLRGMLGRLPEAAGGVTSHCSQACERTPGSGVRRPPGGPPRALRPPTPYSASSSRLR